MKIDLSQRNTKPNLLHQLFPFLFPSFLSIFSISTFKNLLAKYKIWHVGDEKSLRLVRMRKSHYNFVTMNLDLSSYMFTFLKHFAI